MNDVGVIFRRLLAEYGSQHWWPADEPFEIVVGAVLVQRTSWRNAALALDRLKRADMLRAERIAALSPDRLAECVRPAGFWRTKSARLTVIAHRIVECGGMAALARLDTQSLRETLLSCPGIGAETADAILLYAFDRPVVVVDAYLRRIVARLLGRRSATTERADAALRDSIAEAIHSAAMLGEMHALIVAHAKHRCRAKPVCRGCCLLERCVEGRKAVVSAGNEIRLQ